MKKNLKSVAINLEEKVNSIGIDLNKSVSLSKFIDISLNDDLDVSNMDIANLAVILRTQLNQAKDKFDELEGILNL